MWVGLQSVLLAIPAGKAFNQQKQNFSANYSCKVLLPEYTQHSSKLTARKKERERERMNELPANRFGKNSKRWSKYLGSCTHV